MNGHRTFAVGDVVRTLAAPGIYTVSKASDDRVSIRPIGERAEKFTARRAVETLDNIPTLIVQKVS